MLVNETVSYLQMTDRSQLIAGKPAPRPIRVERQDADSWAILSRTFIRIGDQVGKGFQTRRIPPWTETQWRNRLNKPGVVPWLIKVDNEIAGYLELESHGKGDVEIMVFGLVPEFVGKGFGGHALTLAVETAWNAEAIDEVPVDRIWLHTSTRDHPAALTNYKNRGFEVFRTEQAQKDIPSLTYGGPSLA